MKFEEIIVKTHELTFEQFSFNVRNTNRAIRCNVPRPMLMERLSKLIRKHRWELFGTYGPYKIICDGYGGFQYVEMSDSKKRFNAKTILEQIKILDNKLDTPTSL